MAAWIPRALRDLSRNKAGQGTAGSPRIPHCLVGYQSIQTWSIKTRPACVKVCKCKCVKVCMNEFVNVCECVCKAV